MIEIARCQDGDVPALMAFIGRHWREGHVLATSRALMDWQHKGADSVYNYLLARDGHEIVGVLGYIPTCRYDPALQTDNLLWLALWKVRDDRKLAGLGLRMLLALQKAESHSSIGVSGINLAHAPMYRALGYVAADLNQHFVVNPDIKPTLIVAPKGGSALPLPTQGDAEFVELGAEDLQRLALECFDCPVPRKTPVYFANRFLSHPFYQYRVFLISRRAQPLALIAARIAEHQGARALRIIDFMGCPKTWAFSGTALGKLLRAENGEYADFWQFGLPAPALAAAGFGTVDPNGPVVVPNFYEPYLARNGRIVFAVKSSSEAPLVVCRAEGDQDRPNELH